MAVSLYIRNFIFERDNHNCLKCGSGDRLSIDHVVPSSLGGSDAFFNLQTLCEPCNFEKADTIADYRDWVEYPALPDEEPFNWGLSYRDIDVLYKPKKPYIGVSKGFSEVLKNIESKERSFAVTAEYKKTEISKAKRKKEVHIDNPNFITYKGKKCELYGWLKTTIGVGQEKGRGVYYEKSEDKLIIQCYGTHIRYTFDELYKWVDKDIFSSVEKRKQSSKVTPAVVIPIQKVTNKSLEEFTQWYDNLPKNNFHECAEP